jgi:predicted Mrr-cat superfamily restriction endonuclease
MDRRAFILRMSPSKRDRMPFALKHDKLVIGWAEAKALTNPLKTKDDFKEIIRDIYPGLSPGHSASMMWMFLRTMQIGDYVLVPYGDVIYRGIVASEPEYLDACVKDDMAFQRSVEWLGKFSPLARKSFHADVQKAMRRPVTMIDITNKLSMVAPCFA